MSFKAGLGVLAVILCMGVSGCMLKEEVSVEKEFESVMEEKYREKFRFIELVGSHFGRADREAYMECESFPEERIWVYRKVAEDGNRTYGDDYMGYYYSTDIVEKVRQCAEEIYSGCEVSYHVMESYIPADSGPGQSLEEMLIDPNVVFSVEILTVPKNNDGEKEMDLERFRQKLKEKNLRLKGTLTLKNTGQKCFFAMDRAYEFFYADWR